MWATSQHGRVVKAIDLKSIGVPPRRFEPCCWRCRLYSSVVERQSCKLKVQSSILCGGTFFVLYVSQSPSWKVRLKDLTKLPLKDTSFSFFLGQIGRQHVVVKCQPTCIVGVKWHITMFLHPLLTFIPYTNFLFSVIQVTNINHVPNIADLVQPLVHGLFGLVANSVAKS